MKSININARTVGASLKHARYTISILHEDVARMLKISREELTLFENGEVQIPPHILNTIFTLGLTMMHTRYMMNDYQRMMCQWRHMHNRAIELHKKLEKIKITQSPVLQ